MAGFNVHVISCDGPPTVAPTLEGQHWVDTITGRTWLAVGTSTIGDWILVNQNDNEIEVNIGAGSNTDIDTIALSGLCTVKYIVCIHNTSENKWRSFEMLAGKTSINTIEDTVYSSIGAALDVDFTFSVVGNDAVLNVVNNETFSVDIKIHKNLL